MLSVLHRVEAVRAWDPLQFVLAAVLELEPGPGDQQRDGGRSEQFPRSGLLQDTSCEMDGDPADVVASNLDLPRVQPRPDPDPQWRERLSEGRRTADGPPGAVEGGQQPVSGQLDEPSAVLLDDGVGDRIVGLQQTSPSGSPKEAALSVEPTMSVNKIVAKARSVPDAGEVPVTNASIWSRIWV